MSFRDRKRRPGRKCLDMDQSRLGIALFALRCKNIAERIEDDNGTEHEIERKKKIKKDLSEKDHRSTLCHKAMKA